MFKCWTMPVSGSSSPLQDAENASYLRNFIICADGLTFNEQGLASLPNSPPPPHVPDLFWIPGFCPPHTQRLINISKSLIEKLAVVASVPIDGNLLCIITSLIKFNKHEMDLYYNWWSKSIPNVPLNNTISNNIVICKYQQTFKFSNISECQGLLLQYYI